MNRWVSEAVLRAAALCGLGMSVLLVAEYRESDGGAVCSRWRLRDRPRVGLCRAIRRATAAHRCPVFQCRTVPCHRTTSTPLAIALERGRRRCGGGLHCPSSRCSPRLLPLVPRRRRRRADRWRRGVRRPWPDSPTPDGAGRRRPHLRSSGGHCRRTLLARQPRGAAAARRAQPGRVTVVEFVDFECPACREQYGQFSSVLSSYADRVNLVVKHMPLPQHQHALDAARAYCCADERDKAAEMADRLFRAQHLGREDCEEIAVGLGLDRNEFRRCVDSDRVAQRLRTDNTEAAAAGIRGSADLVDRAGTLRRRA